MSDDPWSKFEHDYDNAPVPVIGLVVLLVIFGFVIYAVFSWLL